MSTHIECSRTLHGSSWDIFYLSLIVYMARQKSFLEMILERRGQRAPVLAPKYAYNVQIARKRVNRNTVHNLRRIIRNADRPTKTLTLMRFEQFGEVKNTVCNVRCNIH